jgi:predicted enzyme related to lactoylglutathione lyase
VDPADIDAAAIAITAAGGTVVEQGDFCPGEPYLFATDPDGYTVEIWYELPTPVDPAPDAE